MEGWMLGGMPQRLGCDGDGGCRLGMIASNHNASPLHHLLLLLLLLFFFFFAYRSDLVSDLSAPLQQQLNDLWLILTASIVQRRTSTLMQMMMMEV